MPRLPSLAPQGVKNLWIRTALFEKVLDKIVLYLVDNSRCGNFVSKGAFHIDLFWSIRNHLKRFLSSSKYYEKEAVLMDPVDGPILASLLGKCTCNSSGFNAIKSDEQAFNIDCFSVFFLVFLRSLCLLTCHLSPSEFSSAGIYNLDRFIPAILNRQTAIHLYADGRYCRDFWHSAGVIVQEWKSEFIGEMMN